MVKTFLRHALSRREYTQAVECRSQFKYIWNNYASRELWCPTTHCHMHILGSAEPQPLETFGACNKSWTMTKCYSGREEQSTYNSITIVNELMYDTVQSSVLCSMATTLFDSHANLFLFSKHHGNQRHSH